MKRVITKLDLENFGICWTHAGHPLSRPWGVLTPRRHPIAAYDEIGFRLYYLVNILVKTRIDKIIHVIVINNKKLIHNL